MTSLSKVMGIYPYWQFRSRTPTNVFLTDGNESGIGLLALVRHREESQMRPFHQLLPSNRPPNTRTRVVFLQADSFRSRPFSIRTFWYRTFIPNARDIHPHARGLEKGGCSGCPAIVKMRRLNGSWLWERAFNYPCGILWTRKPS